MCPVERADDDSHPTLSGAAWIVADSQDASTWLAPLPAGFAAGDFLVGGLLCGAACERGIASRLRVAGVAAIIGRSIAPAFFQQATAAGLPAVAIEEAPAIKSGDHLRVDIETYRVVNYSSGDRYIIRNLTDAALDTLRRKAR